MEAKTSKKKGTSRFGIGLLASALVVVVILLLYYGIPEVKAATECAASDGYQYVESRVAQDSDGQDVYIVRGIYSTGEGSAGGKKIILPICASKDPSIDSVRNMFLTLDGQPIFLISGAIGLDLTSPLPETPQP